MVQKSLANEFKKFYIGSWDNGVVIARWNFLANFAREVVIIPPILLQKVKKAYLVTYIDNS